MRLRRKAPVDDDLHDDIDTEGADGGADPGAPSTGDALRAGGPWDAGELQVSPDDPDRIDLGSLSVKGREDVEVRLQVDEASQQVTGLMLVAKDGALELRPFAAARHEDLWATVRPQISSEAARRGGTATEVDSPYGRALELRVPAVDEQGRSGTQISQVMGVAGPRWLLRVTVFGRPAQEWRDDGALEQALRDVVVDRGSEAMPPGESLPLRLPSGAQRVDGPE
jgi:hypothetical protein